MSNFDLSKLKDPFPAEQIEWRLAQCGEKNGKVWAQCLAYVSARAILDRLDEVCGAANWQVSYSFIPASDKMCPGVVCKLAVLVNGHWITKEDGAEQTDIESFKGGISSALKRAGSAWGIGRYLYDLETGFAVVLENKQPGSKWGKTKDGKNFHWAPPSLPEWALPVKPKTSANSNSTPPADAQTQNQNVAPKVVKLPSRAELTGAIMGVAMKLRLNNTDMSARVQKLYKTDIKNLTDPQMANFLSVLEKELATKGAQP